MGKCQLMLVKKGPCHTKRSTLKSWSGCHTKRRTGVDFIDYILENSMSCQKADRYDHIRPYFFCYDNDSGLHGPFTLILWMDSHFEIS